MSDGDRKDSSKRGELERRTVMVGGAATAAAAALPRAAAAQGQENTKSAIYMDPDYKDTFNNKRYDKDHIVDVHDLVHRKFNTKKDLKWGLYQQDVEPDETKWGKNGSAARKGWLDFAREARDDLEKQPAKFVAPVNRIDPSDPNRIAPNMMEHLDEVIRIALWDNAIPISIKVDKKRKRHHEFSTEWTLSGSPPGMSNLAINVWCPDGGWQGYTIWRNGSPGDHITRFVASWKVPPAPANATGPQIIFIFNGLESVSARDAVGGILQPVLQWTRDGWIARSWYVRADFDPMLHPDLPDPTTAVSQQDQIYLDQHRCYSRAVQQPNSTAVQHLREGQTITGVIQGRAGLDGQFKYSCWLEVDNSYRSETLLEVTGIPELSIAVCAVESYDIRQLNTGKPDPNDYPAGPIAMTEVQLQVNANGTAVRPIQWDTSSRKGGDYAPFPSTGGRNIDFKLA